MREGNYVYLRIYGEIDIGDFTSRISVRPTKCIQKNTMGPRLNFPKENSIRYAQVNAGSECSVVDFYDLADKVVGQLEPYTEELKKALEKVRAKAVLQFVVWISTDDESSTPILGLSERAVRFISLLNASVDIDSYIG